MRVQLCLAKQHEISQRIAVLEADYAEWRGTCGLVEMGLGILDQNLAFTAGSICQQGSHEYYRTAINDLHRSRAAMKDC